MKQHWAAPERNKQPILEILQRVLPTHGVLLELASGSGQHAAFFARELPGWTILPSDVDPDNLASIGAWVAEAGLPNLKPPRALDVCSTDWAVPEVDAVFNANMIHIAPFECCLGMLRGAARHLAAHGVLIVYGPFRIDGAHTSRSNEDFDASLQARDPRWGVRDLTDVVLEAEKVGLHLVSRDQMPANNQTLVFRRMAAT